MTLYGESLAEWFKSLISKTFPLTAVGSNHSMSMDLFMWGGYPTSVLNVSGSTEVGSCECNNCTKKYFRSSWKVAKWPTVFMQYETQQKNCCYKWIKQKEVWTLYVYFQRKFKMI
jgi:hypothetical protein